MSPARPAPRYRPLAAHVDSTIASGLIPGAVIAVGRAEGMAYLGAFGRRALEPSREAMTRRTIFDLASLTKVMVTAPLIVERAVRGELSLLDTVARYLRETEGTQVGSIPLHMLLTHTAGFPADNPIEDYFGSKTELLAAIAREPLEAPPGTRFAYSDVGYIVLQLILERGSRRRLDRIAAADLFMPLKYRDTRFGVRPADLKRTAPTEYFREGGSVAECTIPAPGRAPWGAWVGTLAFLGRRRKQRDSAR